MIIPIKSVNCTHFDDESFSRSVIVGWSSLSARFSHGFGKTGSENECFIFCNLPSSCIELIVLFVYKKRSTLVAVGWKLWTRLDNRRKSPAHTSQHIRCGVWLVQQVELLRRAFRFSVVRWDAANGLRPGVLWTIMSLLHVQRIQMQQIKRRRHPQSPCGSNTPFKQTFPSQMPTSPLPRKNA